MKKTAFLLILIVIAAFIPGCTGDINVPDGTYRAQFADFDALGYRDFVEVTVENNEVIAMVANAESGLDGTLKTQNEALRALLEATTGTYPEKYYQDLENQYMSHPNASEMQVIAGAEESSNNIITLLKALEKAQKAGTYTEPCLIVAR